MKKSRFSKQQIAFILKQAEDGSSVEEVCRKAGTPFYQNQVRSIQVESVRSRLLIVCISA